MPDDPDDVADPDEAPPRRRDGTPALPDKDPVVRDADASAVLSYLLGGVILYGGLGWLIDLWLDTRGFVALGIVLGAAGGIALVWLRYSKS